MFEIEKNNRRFINAFENKVIRNLNMYDINTIKMVYNGMRLDLSYNIPLTLKINRLYNMAKIKSHLLFR